MERRLGKGAGGATAGRTAEPGRAVPKDWIIQNLASGKADLRAPLRRLKDFPSPGPVLQTPKWTYLFLIEPTWGGCFQRPMCSEISTFPSHKF